MTGLKQSYPVYASLLLKGYQVRQACLAFREQKQDYEQTNNRKQKTARSEERTA